MNYQSASRNHRTKGFQGKQALKSAMFLALCIWLLYQCKNSRDTTKDKRIKVHIKLGEEHSAMILGRQGNEARYSSGSDSNSKDVDSMGEKSDEEETYIKEKEHNRESIESDEEKQDRKDNERKNENPESNEENNPGIVLRLNKDLNNGDQRLRVNEERDLNEQQNVEEGRSWTLILQKDEAYKENIEDKDRIEETGNGEIEDGFHRFQDENGVPEDVDHIIESMPSESSADKKSYLLQESRNRSIDSMPRGGGREIMSRTSDNMPRGGGRKMMSRTSDNMPRGGRRML
ncbi:hypothetical protein RHSIM_Rhsim05G0041100 [Rhododendron simsii]|uniref:Uncharacterized protein n=1 Tax=Rhododendron simsii TaxID=118357 RepID=A0A834LP53_RHOSS|nr:hypothetical protein RHSIM_Rhsim05G0041100 [Rhododendron simsii]